MLMHRRRWKDSLADAHGRNKKPDPVESAEELSEGEIVPFYTILCGDKETSGIGMGWKICQNSGKEACDDISRQISLGK